MKVALWSTAAMALVICQPLMASAQEATKPYDRTKPYPAYTAPFMANGQPDLQGVWSNVTMTTTTRPAALKDRLVYTEAEVAALEAARVAEVDASNVPTPVDAAVDYRAPGTVNAAELAAGGGSGTYNNFWKDPGNAIMRVNGQPRTSILTTPNGAFPAAKPGAAATQVVETPAYTKLLGDSPVPRGGSFDNPESRGNGERCIVSFGRNGGPPMLANGWYNNNYQLVQSPDHVMIVVEMNHDARIVRINGKHRTDGLRPYFGDSIGWYEGDTLVVETTNIPRSQAYAGSWQNLKVTERFKRVAEDRLLYTFKVEDPAFWDQPWGGEYEFHPLGSRMYEYACHEGNYAMHGILAGARIEEERAAKAKAEAEAKKAKPSKAKAKGSR